MHKTLSLLAVPLLLTSTSIFGFLTIKNNWNFELSSYSIFLFTLIYILFLESLIPLKKEWNPTKKSIWIDLKHFIFSAALFDALGKMMTLYIVLILQETFFYSLNLWDTSPLIITYIIANLIGELLPYLYHRISHKGTKNSYLSIFLWKIHSIHHIPTKLNWFKTNWVHPINMFLNVIFKMLPLLLLGFNKEVIYLVGITHIIVAYISHANIYTQKSFWDYVIVTPHIHHFHHSKKIKEAKNFGNTFPFWDLLLGTYYNRIGTVKEVGVIEEINSNYPKKNNYLKHIMYPFLSFKTCCK